MQEKPRGGIVIAMAEKYGLPIRFIDVVEAMEDLRPFSAQDSAQEFARALLPEKAGHVVCRVDLKTQNPLSVLTA